MKEKHMKLRKIQIVLLISAILFLNNAIPQAVAIEDRNLLKPVLNTVIHDGVISPGEYNHTLLLSAQDNFYLHYAVNGSMIYFAMEADVTGYISIGFGEHMTDADIIIGAVTTGVASVSDSYGNSGSSIAVDTSQDIDSFEGSENATSTVIEFSRELDTGDTSEDAIITLDTDIALIWAVHPTDDNFATYHGSRGYGTLRIVTTNSASAPLSISAEYVDDHVLVGWAAPTTDGGAAITEYNVYRTTTSGSGYSLIGTNTSALSYIDTSFVTGGESYYIVAAVTSVGVGENSTEVSISLPSPMVTPTNFNVTAGNAKVTITWEDSVNDDTVVYYLYRSNASDGVFVNIASISDLKYVDKAVENGIEYFYYVTAYNMLGESLPTSTISAIPDLPPIDPIVYVGPTIAVVISAAILVTMFILIKRINKS